MKNNKYGKKVKSPKIRLKIKMEAEANERKAQKPQCKYGKVGSLMKGRD